VADCVCRYKRARVYIFAHTPDRATTTKTQRQPRRRRGGRAGGRASGKLLPLLFCGNTLSPAWPPTTHLRSGPTCRRSPSMRVRRARRRRRRRRRRRCNRCRCPNPQATRQHIVSVSTAIAYCNMPLATQREASFGDSAFAKRQPPRPAFAASVLTRRSAYPAR
jgi:hypothetical protein